MRSVPSFKLCSASHCAAADAMPLSSADPTVLPLLSLWPPSQSSLLEISMLHFLFHSVSSQGPRSRWSLKKEETLKHLQKDGFLYTATALRLCFQRGLPMSQRVQCHPRVNILFPSLTWSSSEPLWLSEMRSIFILCEVSSKRLGLLFVSLITILLSILLQTCVNLYWRKKNTNDSSAIECAQSSVFE